LSTFAATIIECNKLVFRFGRGNQLSVNGCGLMVSVFASWIEGLGFDFSQTIQQYNVKVVKLIVTKFEKLFVE